MSLLAIVIAGNVSLILMRPYIPLVSVYVYRPIVVPKSCAYVVPFPLVVRAGYREFGYPSLPLLLAYELSIVDMDCYSNILVEGTGSVYLI